MDNVEMVVDSVHTALMDYDRVVILKEKDGDRYLPIAIHPLAASGISIQQQPLPDPLYEFIFSLMNSLGATLKEVIVDKLEKEIFRAKVALTHGRETVDVPCSLSDGIAIAVRAKVPILVTESILSKAGIRVDEMKRMTGDKSQDAG